MWTACGLTSNIIRGGDGMKIAQINMIHYGSTGRIMMQIADLVRQHGNQVMTYSTIPYDRYKKSISDFPNGHFIFGSRLENQVHYYLGSLFGRNGCFSYFGSKELIRQLRLFNPDVVHLHNLHKFCINIPMLFNYLKGSNVPVLWTLHDCWAFTGQCPHFTMVKCDKWKTGCSHCPQIGIYPKSRIDNSKQMYFLKKQWFTGVENMTIVTPSQWLADLVKESFLKNYPVKVINNGIDLNIFKPTISNFRERNRISKDKYIILGVAFGWGARKGLDIFIELAKRLDSRFQIVLVGTDDSVDGALPNNILSIHRTESKKELAEIYTAADLFVNPTREDNFPTVNMESIACGTPVLTFRTGGSPEILDETCGSVVACDDVDAFEQEIRRICTNRAYSQEACLQRAKSFDMNTKFKEYMKLYEDCTHSFVGAIH